MNTDQFAVVSSIYTLGGLLGAFLAGYLSGKMGRKQVMLILTSFFILGPIIGAPAENIPALIFSRLISGLGAGGAVVVAPIYISEISPPEYKGIFGSVTQIMICFGIFVAQLLGYFLSRGNLWRIILAVPGVIGISQLLGTAMILESSKWLAEQNKAQQAKETLQKMRGSSYRCDREIESWNTHESPEDAGKSESSSLLSCSSVSDYILTAEEESLLASPSQNSSKRTETYTVGLVQAFVDPHYRPAIIAVVAVMATQQLTGINSIVMYSVSTLSTLLPTTAALLTVFISVFNIIVTTVCAPLADLFGRKACLLASVAGMGINALLLAAGMSFGIKPLAAVASLLFVGSFAVGLGPIPFILASELVGPEAVGAAQSWALASNWIATFVVSQFFPILNQAMGERGRVYVVFTAFALILGSFIAWWVPETKGKQDVDEVWGRKESRERLE